MAAADTIAEDLPWSVDEWLVIEPGERATDHAIDILEDAGPNERVTVKRALEYARAERPAHAVKAPDWARVLEHADGRLAFVSWSSGGVTEIGLKDDRDQRRAFDVWMFSALRESEQRDDATSAGVTDLLRDAKPAIVPIWDSHLRPEMVPDGGQSVDGIERQTALTSHAGREIAEPVRGDERHIRCPDCGQIVSASKGSHPAPDDAPTDRIWGWQCRICENTLPSNALEDDAPTFNDRITAVRVMFRDGSERLVPAPKTHVDGGESA